MTSNPTDDRPEIPGEYSEIYPKEHVAYMRGYAAALSAAAPDVHKVQIERIRKEYGYAAGERR